MIVFKWPQFHVYLFYFSLIGANMLFWKFR